MSSLTLISQNRRVIQAGETGLVLVTSIVRNPRNARIYINPDELDELVESIKANGQGEVLTVRHLTDAERKLDPATDYMIVGGERRLTAIKLAGLTKCHVIVKAFEDVADELMHARILNTGRSELSDLEKALEMQQIAALRAWKTDEEIAKNLGEKLGWVTQMRAILRLSPYVQDLMHPRNPVDERPKRQAATFLAPLSHGEQDALMRRMPRELSTGMAQVAWLRGMRERQNPEPRSRQKQPDNLRKSIEKLVLGVVDRVATLEDAGMRRIWEGVSAKEKSRLLGDVSRGINALARLKVAAEYAEPPKSIARPPPQKKSPPPKPMAATVVPAPRPSTHVPPPRDLTLDAVVMNIREVQRPSVPSSSGRMVNVAYKTEGGGFKSERVPLKRYKELSDQKLLMYQVQGEKRPGNYPDPATICG